MPWIYYECLLTIADAYVAFYDLAPPGYLPRYRYYCRIAQAP